MFTIAPLIYEHVNLRQFFCCLLFQMHADILQNIFHNICLMAMEELLSKKASNMFLINVQN